ncbi:hypothetical protein Dimus_036045 [Dionaea muscipula]
METLEEEIEVRPEDERCPSSNGDSSSSDSSGDDEVAECVDVGNKGDNFRVVKPSISGIHHPPDILGLPEPHLHPDSDSANPKEPSQVNPNPSVPSIPSLNTCSLTNFCSNEHDIVMDSILNHATMGLSVEYTYPSSEEDNCSLHAIDDEELDETLDGDSIHSDGDTFGETILDPSVNPPLMLSSDIGDAHLGEPDDASILDGDFHPQPGLCGDSTMESPPQNPLNLDPLPCPPLQPQIEEVQISRMAMDGPIPLDDEINMKSGPREPPIKSLSADSYGLLPFLTMGKKKKKKWIPFSQWTPVVQGLSTDASEASCENADLEASNPMEPIEEESEIISEDESCSSSNGEFATSELASDEVDSQGNDGVIEPSTNLGILPHSGILGFPEVRIAPQSEHPANQMNLQANPNSSIPPMDVCEASNLSILGGETDNQVISNSQLNSKPDDLHEVTCSRDSEPSSSIPADANHVHGTRLVEFKYPSSKRIIALSTPSTRKNVRIHLIPHPILLMAIRVMKNNSSMNLTDGRPRNCEIGGFLSTTTP